MYVFRIILKINSNFFTLNVINRLFFVFQTQCVNFEIQIELLNIIHMIIDV
jgi:hypothetical protein